MSLAPSHRRRRLTCALVLSALGLAGSGRLAATTEPAPLRFAFSSQIFAEVNESDAHAALKIWAQSLGSDYGIPVDPSLEILAGTEAIRHALLDRRVDGMSMTTVEYWELRRTVTFAPTILVGLSRGASAEQYVLLVHRDNPATRLADLRGQSLAIFTGPRASLGAAWIETLSLEKHLGTTRTFWSRSSTLAKVSQAILPVYFKKLDACVVTREAFRTMAELNPQVGQQLRVLVQSPPLVSAPLCFRGDLDSPYRDKLIANIGQVANTAGGRQTLSLFHSEQILARPVSDLDEACALLDRHALLLAEQENHRPGPPTSGGGSGSP